jgi:hypothetical protein
MIQCVSYILSKHFLSQHFRTWAWKYSTVDLQFSQLRVGKSKHILNYFCRWIFQKKAYLKNYKWKMLTLLQLEFWNKRTRRFVRYDVYVTAGVDFLTEFGKTKEKEPSVSYLSITISM